MTDNTEVPSSTLQLLPEGTCARIMGLNAAPRFNGMVGNIVNWVPERQRYTFHLELEGQLRIKSENLQVITAERCSNTNCEFVLPAVAIDVDDNGYNNEKYERHICCGKLLCTTCTALRTTPQTVNKCQVCGAKKKPIIIGSKTDIAFLKKHSKKKKAWASCMLGLRYVGGQGVKGNHAKALRYFVMGAKLGHADSQYHAAVLYGGGQGCDQDFQQAAFYHTAAVAQKHHCALSNLAVMFANGQVPVHPPSIQRARQLYRRAADLGNIPAAGIYGAMCMNGEGGPQDLEIAKKCLQMAAASEENLSAMCNLAMFYNTIEPYDTTAAIALWKKVVRVNARKNVGVHVQMDRECVQRAIQYLKAYDGDGSADKKEQEQNRPKTTQVVTGVPSKYIDKRNESEKNCYVCKDRLGWNALLTAASCCGRLSHPQCSKAKKKSRCPFCNKQLVDANSKKQFRQYLALAKQGCAWAQTTVGSMYLRNVQANAPSRYNVPMDLEKGKRWYEKAAGNGDPNALYHLGACYLPPDFAGSVVGFPDSMDTVEQYWTLAAVAGQPMAMHRLGRYYMEGSFGAVDLDNAMKWLKAAGNHGVEEAQELWQQLGESTSNSHAFQNCDFCGKQNRSKLLKTCGACGTVKYCNAECGKADWRRHKKDCKNMSGKH